MARRCIRIVSDGTCNGTKVYGPKGEDLAKMLSIREVRWSVRADHGPAIAEATLVCQGVEIVAEATEAQIECHQDPRAAGA